METSPQLEAFFFRDLKNSYISEILKEIYRDQVYAPFLDGKQVDTILDIGGNIGLTSYYFKDFAKQVFCVEPSVRHRECIDKLIEFNGVKNIKVVPLALSNENGTEKFYHPENVTMYSMENVMDAKDYEEVETVTAVELVKRLGLTHVDLCKFDVEGSESKIIASDEFKALTDITDVFVGEWHSWTQMSQDQFANAFSDLGYDFRWLPTEAQVFTAVKR